MSDIPGHTPAERMADWFAMPGTERGDKTTNKKEKDMENCMDKGLPDEMQLSTIFAPSPSVHSSRILYTPSPFARTSLLHLQEVGSLTAIRPHTSKREKLQSYLCFVVEDGEGELVYEGKRFDLRAGDAVFIDCRRAYSHSTDDASGKKFWSLQWCHFHGPSMPAVYAKYCERGGSPVIRPEDPAPYEALLSELYLLASSPDYIRDMRINEKLNALLTLLMEASWHREFRASAPRKMEISRVKAFLDEHYREKLSLEDVAGRFFVDKHYLARLFKAQYGVTLVTYLQQVRITHAKQMLRFTDRSVEEIGLECGVGELNYFSRVFKKLEGVSPSEFRKLW